MVGDRLEIRRGDSLIAELEVVFAAENSASCKIINSQGFIGIGDMAMISSPVTRPTAPVTEPVVASAPPVAAQPAVTKPKPLRAKISGGASIQIHNWNDRSAGNLDFTQPSFRLNLKSSRLWGKDLNLNARITARYNKRTRAYNSDVPETEWRNRIYQLSFGYANEQAPFSFEFGRIISNKMSGVGYIDGILMQKGITEEFHVGAFAGTQPEWQYSEFQTSLQKYGGYLGYTRGDFKAHRLESTVAAAGAYHSGTVSREFLYVRNAVTLAGRWNIFQSAEIDLNRDWRKAKSGSSADLSNLYLSGRGRFTNWLSAGLSYDNRRNYWTYETRSVSDSLFDDVLRRGLRTDISLRPGRNYFMSGNFGYHKRSVDESGTYSYSAGLNMTNFILNNQGINLQYAGFNGPFTDGNNFSVRFSRYFLRSNMISVGYGAYIYTFGAGSLRTNDWVQLSGQFDLVRRLYSSATYEYNMGDDTRGHRVIAEVGYRF
jgi:hypothetical protein